MTWPLILLLICNAINNSHRQPRQRTTTPNTTVKTPTVALPFLNGNTGILNQTSKATTIPFRPMSILLRISHQNPGSYESIHKSHNTRMSRRITTILILSKTHKWVTTFNNYKYFHLDNFSCLIFCLQYI